MLERDLQDYLFENPDVLFPGQIVTRKRREVFIEGRRVDLIFEVEGMQYIVELKRDTIKREHVGQLVEYYGLLRLKYRDISYKMILVAPVIPAYRSIPLEELFGIRCIQMVCPPNTRAERSELVQESIADQRHERTAIAMESTRALPIAHLRLEDLLSQTSPSVLLSHQLLRDGFTTVRKAYPEYEVLHVKMLRPNTSETLCFPADAMYAEPRFSTGGVWWAFAFGHSEQTPKNDIPNISVNAYPWGLDFAVNAELRTSQQVMRNRIAASPERFDVLVSEHGNLGLQAWLKLEHQPRFYQWILLTQQPHGTWRAQDLLEMYRRMELDFDGLRKEWLTWIKDHRQELTARQRGHMEQKNRRLNLALRLVRTFPKEDEVWTLPYEAQKLRFDAEYCKLKPLIDFFQ